MAASRIIIKHLQEKNNQLLHKITVHEKRKLHKILTCEEWSQLVGGKIKVEANEIKAHKERVELYDEEVRKLAEESDKIAKEFEVCVPTESASELLLPEVGGAVAVRSDIVSPDHDVKKTSVIVSEEQLRKLAQEADEITREFTAEYGIPVKGAMTKSDEAVKPRPARTTPTRKSLIKSRKLDSIAEEMPEDVKLEEITGTKIVKELLEKEATQELSIGVEATQEEMEDVFGEALELINEQIMDDDVKKEIVTIAEDVASKLIRKTITSLQLPAAGKQEIVSAETVEEQIDETTREGLKHINETMLFDEAKREIVSAAEDIASKVIRKTIGLLDAPTISERKSKAGDEFLQDLAAETSMDQVAESIPPDDAQKELVAIIENIVAKLSKAMLTMHELIAEEKLDEIIAKQALTHADEEECIVSITEPHRPEIEGAIYEETKQEIVSVVRSLSSQIIIRTISLVHQQAISDKPEEQLAKQESAFIEVEAIQDQLLETCCEHLDSVAEDIMYGEAKKEIIEIAAEMATKAIRTTIRLLQEQPTEATQEQITDIIYEHLHTVVKDIHDEAKREVVPVADDLASKITKTTIALLEHPYETEKKAKQETAITSAEIAQELLPELIGELLEPIPDCTDCFEAKKEVVAILDDAIAVLVGKSVSLLQATCRNIAAKYELEIIGTEAGQYQIDESTSETLESVDKNALLATAKKEMSGVLEDMASKVIRRTITLIQQQKEEMMAKQTTVLATEEATQEILPDTFRENLQSIVENIMHGEAKKEIIEIVAEMASKAIGTTITLLQQPKHEKTQFGTEVTQEQIAEFICDNLQTVAESTIQDEAKKEVVPVAEDLASKVITTTITLLQHSLISPEEKTAKLQEAIVGAEVTQEKLPELVSELLQPISQCPVSSTAKKELVSVMEDTISTLVGKSVALLQDQSTAEEIKLVSTGAAQISKPKSETLGPIDVNVSLASAKKEFASVLEDMASKVVTETVNLIRQQMEDICEEMKAKQNMMLASEEAVHERLPEIFSEHLQTIPEVIQYRDAKKEIIEIATEMASKPTTTAIRLSQQPTIAKQERLLVGAEVAQEQLPSVTSDNIQNIVKSTIQDEAKKEVVPVAEDIASKIVTTTIALLQDSHATSEEKKAVEQTVSVEVAEEQLPEIISRHLQSISESPNETAAKKELVSILEDTVSELVGTSNALLQDQTLEAFDKHAILDAAQRDMAGALEDMASKFIETTISLTQPHIAETPEEIKAIQDEGVVEDELTKALSVQERLKAERVRFDEAKQEIVSVVAKMASEAIGATISLLPLPAQVVPQEQTERMVYAEARREVTPVVDDMASRIVNNTIILLQHKSLEKMRTEEQRALPGPDITQEQLPNLIRELLQSTSTSKKYSKTREELVSILDDTISVLLNKSINLIQQETTDMEKQVEMKPGIKDEGQTAQTKSEQLMDIGSNAILDAAKKEMASVLDEMSSKVILKTISLLRHEIIETRQELADVRDMIAAAEVKIPATETVQELLPEKFSEHMHSIVEDVMHGETKKEIIEVVTEMASRTIGATATLLQQSTTGMLSTEVTPEQVAKLISDNLLTIGESTMHDEARKEVVPIADDKASQLIKTTISLTQHLVTPEEMKEKQKTATEEANIAQEQLPVVISGVLQSIVGLQDSTEVKNELVSILEDTIATLASKSITLLQNQAAAESIDNNELLETTKKEMANVLEDMASKVITKTLSLVKQPVTTDDAQSQLQQILSEHEANVGETPTELLATKDLAIVGGEASELQVTDLGAIAITSESDMVAYLQAIKETVIPGEDAEINKEGTPVILLDQTVIEELPTELLAKDNLDFVGEEVAGLQITELETLALKPDTERPSYLEAMLAVTKPGEDIAPTVADTPVTLVDQGIVSGIPTELLATQDLSIIDTEAAELQIADLAAVALKHETELPSVLESMLEVTTPGEDNAPIITETSATLLDQAILDGTPTELLATQDMSIVGGEAVELQITRLASLTLKPEIEQSSYLEAMVGVTAPGEDIAPIVVDSPTLLDQSILEKAITEQLAIQNLAIAIEEAVELQRADLPAIKPESERATYLEASLEVPKPAEDVEAVAMAATELFAVQDLAMVISEAAEPQVPESASLALKPVTERLSQLEAMLQVTIPGEDISPTIAGPPTLLEKAVQDRTVTEQLATQDLIIVSGETAERQIDGLAAFALKPETEPPLYLEGKSEMIAPAEDVAPIVTSTTVAMLDQVPGGTLTELLSRQDMTVVGAETTEQQIAGLAAVALKPDIERTSHFEAISSVITPGEDLAPLVAGTPASLLEKAITDGAPTITEKPISLSENEPDSKGLKMEKIVEGMDTVKSGVAETRGISPGEDFATGVAGTPATLLDKAVRDGTPTEFLATKDLAIIGGQATESQTPELTAHALKPETEQMTYKEVIAAVKGMTPTITERPISLFGNEDSKDLNMEKIVAGTDAVKSGGIETSGISGKTPETKAGTISDAIPQEVTKTINLLHQPIGKEASHQEPGTKEKRITVVLESPEQEKETGIGLPVKKQILEDTKEKALGLPGGSVDVTKEVKLDKLSDRITPELQSQLEKESKTEAALLKGVPDSELVRGMPTSRIKGVTNLIDKEDLDLDALFSISFDLNLERGKGSRRFKRIDTTNQRNLDTAQQFELRDINVESTSVIPTAQQTGDTADNLIEESQTSEKPHHMDITVNPSIKTVTEKSSRNDITEKSSRKDITEKGSQKEVTEKPSHDDVITGKASTSKLADHVGRDVAGIEASEGRVSSALKMDVDFKDSAKTCVEGVLSSRKKFVCRRYKISIADKINLFGLETLTLEELCKLHEEVVRRVCSLMGSKRKDDSERDNEFAEYVQTLAFDKLAELHDMISKIAKEKYVRTHSKQQYPNICDQLPKSPSGRCYCKDKMFTPDIVAKCYCKDTSFDPKVARSNESALKLSTKSQKKCYCKDKKFSPNTVKEKKTLKRVRTTESVSKLPSQMEKNEGKAVLDMVPGYDCPKTIRSSESVVKSSTKALLTHCKAKRYTSNTIAKYCKDNQSVTNDRHSKQLSKLQGIIRPNMAVECYSKWRQSTIIRSSESVLKLPPKTSKKYSNDKVMSNIATKFYSKDQNFNAKIPSSSKTVPKSPSKSQRKCSKDKSVQPCITPECLCNNKCSGEFKNMNTSSKQDELLKKSKKYECRFNSLQCRHTNKLNRYSS